MVKKRNKKYRMKNESKKYINIRDFEQDEYPLTFILGSRGCGKAEPLTNKIYTSNGWKLFGDLTLHDMIYTPKGELTKIVGIYPQGKRDIYEITFRDGRKVQASDNHLWKINVHGNTRLYTTQSLYNKKGIMQYAVELPNPVIFPKEKHIIDPWVVGAMLGDGSCTAKHIHFTSVDRENVVRMRNKLGASYFRSQGKRGIQWAFYHEIGSNARVQNNLPDVVKTTSLYKRIPKEYIYTSVEDRLELLAGLMDTDGTVRKDGTLQYCSISYILLLDIQRLVNTLGGTTIISSRKGYKQKHLAYDIVIRLPYEMRLKIVHLSRKKDRVKPDISARKNLYIKNIEYVGKKKCQCIEVADNEHMYLTGDFIPTHNTISTFVESVKIFKEKGLKSIYLRRYQTEIETTAIDLGLIGELTDSEISRGKVKVNGVSTDMVMVDGEPAIYMLSLSTASKYKSSSFSDVYWVVNDEFLDLSNRELRDETNKFMQFMMTVFRDFSKFKCMMLSNATNIFNCYFLDFEVMPESKITKYREKGIKIVMYQTSEELKKEQEKTILATLVSTLEGDEGSSLENKFTANFDNFISKLSKNAKYVGTYKLNDELYGCYKEKDYYLISRKYDESFKRKNALSYEDVDEDYELINWEAYSTLRGWFMKRRVRFTDVKTRTAFIRRFKKMSLYSD